MILSGKINKKCGRVLLGVLSCCVVTTGCSGLNNDSDTKDIQWQFQINEDSMEAGETAVSDEAFKQPDDISIFVHLCGAVNNPGVYEVPEGSRLYELLALAGGLREDADEAYENLARVVVDGEQIVILTADEAIEKREYAVQQEIIVNSGMVNINTASESELLSIAGIGASRAKAIVDYRNAYGRFNSIEDIMLVDGIKEGLFGKIKDKITVGH